MERHASIIEFGPAANIEAGEFRIFSASPQCYFKATSHVGANEKIQVEIVTIGMKSFPFRDIEQWPTVQPYEAIAIGVRFIKDCENFSFALLGRTKEAPRLEI